MTIEDRLYEHGIKKMLIADDRFTDAAKGYFKDYSKIKIDYATSGKDAIKMIQSEYPKQKYDLVLSDMEMETFHSGADVSIESFKHQTLCLIVTGQAAGGYGPHAHGPRTKIMGPGYDKMVDGSKEYSDTWMKVSDYVSEYFSKEGKMIFDSLQMHYKYVGKASDELKDIIRDISR